MHRSVDALTRVMVAVVAAAATVRPVIAVVVFFILLWGCLVGKEGANVDEGRCFASGCEVVRREGGLRWLGGIGVRGGWG